VHYDQHRINGPGRRAGDQCPDAAAFRWSLRLNFEQTDHQGRQLNLAVLKGFKDVFLCGHFPIAPHFRNHENRSFQENHCRALTVTNSSSNTAIASVIAITVNGIDTSSVSNGGGDGGGTDRCFSGSTSFFGFHRRRGP